MRCPRCNTDNPANSRFCTNCGSSLLAECPNCKTQNSLGSKFCSQCGTKLESQAKESKPSATETIPYAERRQLTVLFSDIIGSTALSEQLDPEDLRTILREYQAACSKVIKLYDGYLAKYLGDGVLAYFGYPTAHEDDPRRAVQAGLGIAEAMLALRDRFQKESGVSIDIRVGIHTGLVVVGDMDQKDVLESNAIVGQTPNLAARIQSVADTNSVVVSGDTYKLIRGYFETTDLGAHELKGISQAIQLFRIDHQSTARSRLDAAIGELTPFVGRSADIRRILERWETVKTGGGQVVLLGGEAGVGKSRLLLSLKEHVSNEEGSWLTELRCSPYHQNSIYYPLIDFLERYPLRFERDDTAEKKLSKIEGFLTTVGKDPNETVPLLAALLSVPLGGKYTPPVMTPQRQRLLTNELLLSILLGRSDKQPVLFVLEDLHWADPSSFELLDQLIERSENHKILIFLTYRPQFTPYWQARENMIRIELTGLAKANAAEIIARVAGNKKLPKEAVDYIIQKTDGIPLFLEELTKSMIESDMLLEKEDRFEMSAPLHTLGVPATIQDSLTSRLDRLPEAKQVAQLGAAIGREFSYDILEAIPGPHHQNLQSHLDRLVQAGILYQRGYPPNATYMFKHALIQDSAYGSLLKTSRKDYHRLIAEAIESHTPELVETQPELLAQHHSQAGNTQKAIGYWLSAGIRALQRSANAEAIAHMKQGLALLSSLSDEVLRLQFELQLQSAIGPALIAMRGFGDSEVGATFNRAGELSTQLGDGPHLFTPTWGQWVYYLVRDELDKARSLSLEMKRLGEASNDTGMLVEAHWTLGDTIFWLGDLEGSKRELDDAVAIYDASRHHINAYLYGQDPGVAAYCYQVYTYWFLGYPDKAEQAYLNALSLAETLKHPFSIGWALAFSMMVFLFDENPERALEQAEKTIAYCTEQAYPFWLFGAIIVRGWAIAKLRTPAEGIPIIEQGLAGWAMIGSIIVRPLFLGVFAEVLGMNGEYERALATLDEAFALSREHKELASEIDLHRVKGIILQRMGRSEEAERSIREGIALARSLGAHSCELKAATALCKLLHENGRDAESTTELSAAYAFFTEGFSRPYLRDAKAMLK